MGFVYSGYKFQDQLSKFYPDKKTQQGLGKQQHKRIISDD